MYNCFLKYPSLQELAWTHHHNPKEVPMPTNPYSNYRIIPAAEKFSNTGTPSKFPADKYKVCECEVLEKTTDENGQEWVIAEIEVNKN